MYSPYILKIWKVQLRPISHMGVLKYGQKWTQKSFWSRLRYHSTYFLKVEIFGFTWTGYGDDVIDHFRKKSLFFRDTREHPEHDAKNRLWISITSSEKTLAEIASVKKKTDLIFGKLHWKYPFYHPKKKEIISLPCCRWSDFCKCFRFSIRLK